MYKYPATPLKDIAARAAVKVHIEPLAHRKQSTTYISYHVNGLLFLAKVLCAAREAEEEGARLLGTQQEYKEELAALRAQLQQAEASGSQVT